MALVGLALFFSCSGKDVDSFPLWDSMGAGSSHSCALSSGGILWCWGANGYGQLGDGSTSNRSRPVRVEWDRETGFRQVAMGHAHTCAVDGDGVLACWGDNTFGQLGDGSQWDRILPGEVRRGVKAVAAGYVHTCALLQDHSVVCWGFNGSGQLGDGSREDRFRPVAVNLGRGASVLGVTVGFSHSCALLDNYSVHCWGGNDFGQLGDGSMIDRLEPVAVDSWWSSQVTSVVAGDSHTCVVLEEGFLECWGSNRHGQLGDAVGPESTRPVRIDWDSIGAVRGVALGKDTTCVVGDGGLLACRGANGYGQLGNGSTLPSSGAVPVDWGPPREVRSLVAGGGHLCVLSRDDFLGCWGNNDQGQLGDGREWEAACGGEVACLQAQTAVRTPHRGDEPGEMGANLFSISVER